MNEVQISHIHPEQLDRQVHEAAKKEIDKLYDELYEKFARDIVYQTLAVVFRALNLSYGFGPKRLQRLKDCTEDLFVMIDRGALGKKSTVKDIRDWLKEKYGIDFEESQYKEKEEEE